MKRLKIKLIIISVVFLLVFIGNIILKKLDCALIVFAETKGETHVCEIINQCITETSERILSKEPISKIHYNSKGEIIAITVNSEAVNKIKGETMSSIIQKLKNDNSNSFKIPLGTLLGSRFFSAQGPDIEIEIIPLGTVASELKQKFTSAGINQTLHSLYLDVRISVKIASPFSSAKIDISTNVCISETVIVGNIPFGYID